MSKHLTEQELEEFLIPDTEASQHNGHSHEQPVFYEQEPIMHEPKAYKFTEFGNAERMIDAYGQDIRWNKAFGFIFWDGQRWVMDSDVLIESLAWETIRNIYYDASYYDTLAAQCQDSEKRKEYGEKARKLTAWALRSESHSMVYAMLKLVRSRTGIYIRDTHVFDNHLTSTYKLNFQNGTLDMTPGAWKFYAHKREDYLTNILMFNYTPFEAAKELVFTYSPYEVKQTGRLFDVFLENITCGNSELARYIQKALGLSLTGYTKEEAWFLLIGQGENGKTTLFDLIVHIMGEYAIRVDAKTIEATNANKGGANATPDIARLKGKRLAVIAETEEGAVLAASRLKDMATGEQVTARFLNRDNFQFYQTHKVFIYTNHLPQVRDTSHGFWRRVGYVPFDYTVPADKKDRDLIFKMQKEAEYVLSWMIEGERLRQQEGMSKPEIVQARTNQYRESQDLIAQFVHENCIIDAREQVAAKVFQGAFKTWIEEEMGFSKALTTQAVKRMMLDHGYAHKHTKHGKIYTGLRMRNEDEPEPEIEPERCTSVHGVQDLQVFPIENTSIDFHSEKGTPYTLVHPTNEHKQQEIEPEKVTGDGGDGDFKVFPIENVSIDFHSKSPSPSVTRHPTNEHEQLETSHDEQPAISSQTEQHEQQVHTSHRKPMKPKPDFYCYQCEVLHIEGSSWQWDRETHNWICTNMVKHGRQVTLTEDEINVFGPKR